MHTLVRRFAIALALLFAMLSSGVADAQRAARSAQKAPAAQQKLKDGRSARAAVMQNQARKGRSTANLRVTASGESRSGKSLQVLAQNGNKNVRQLNVRHSNRVAYETPTQAREQAEAKKTAHQVLRRKNGTYAGVHQSGLSNSGKSYVFTQKSNRARKADVNVLSGQARTRTQR
jgi:Skp family chaperone for outer membrane proteins